MTPVYVIACDEIPDRKQTVHDHLLRLGITHTFVRSVHGKTWGLRTTHQYDPGKYISAGHVGLDLGHWIAWQVAYNSVYHDETWMMFLEDDAVLPDGWHNRLRELLLEIDARFPACEFCFVGLCETQPHVWHKVTERIGGGDSRLCRLNDPFGTHAYIVRKRALPVLMDRCAIAERNMDQQLFQRVLRDNHVQWCAVLPTLVTQRTYDYAGVGKPEWTPSCIDVDKDGKEIPALAADEQDVKRDLGIDVPARPTPELYAATMNLIDPLPCLYRGEFLDEPGKMANGRTVPLAQCARLDKPCHTRPGVNVEIAPGRGMAVQCETCDLRLEMASHGVRERLDLPDGHFNPSVIRWGDRLVLATRDSWGHSRVALWNLTNTLPDWSGKWSVSPIGSYASDHPEASRLEDPRLFVAPDVAGKPTLCAMFNLPDGYAPVKHVKVGYVEFADDLSQVVATRVFNSPLGNLYEKNWAPFYHEGTGLNWVYQSKPEHVVIGEQQTWKTANPLPWTGGFVRGGAAPVQMMKLVGVGEMPKDNLTPGLVPLTFPGNDRTYWFDKNQHVYYHFFHGCLARAKGRVYTAGCLVFEAKPPFRVLRQTKTPLIWPDLPAVGEEVTKRYVVWPGGAVPHAGAWHLAVGIDDTFVRMVRLPFADVESALQDVPETEKVTSLRDGPMAFGTNW